MATYESETHYGVCPILNRADVEAMSDKELVDGYDEWNRDHGVFDWEAGFNAGEIRGEIARRASSEPVDGSLRAFASQNWIEVV